MKKRIFALVLILALMLGLSTTAGAYTNKQLRAAEALYHLDLFRGRTTAGKDFDLDGGLNRAEGTLMVIRLLGKETEAYTRDVANTPFPDVADFWGGKCQFIAYAYETGLMKGVTTTVKGVTTLTFEPRAPMSDRMFLTLILRVLGYQDGADNYIWKNAWTLAYEAGLVDSAEKDDNFTRGDAVQVAWKAMGAKLQDSGKTLAQKLMGEGLFSSEEYAEAKEIWSYGYILPDDSGSDTPSAPDTPDTPSTPSNPNWFEGSPGEDD